MQFWRSRKQATLPTVGSSSDDAKPTQQQALQWTPRSSFLDWALIAQVLVIAVSILTYIDSAGSKHGPNFFPLKNCWLIPIWALHVFYRLNFSSSTYTCLGTELMSDKAAEMFRRFALSPPEILLTINADLSSDDVAVMAKRFVYDSWENEYPFEDIVWPSGISIVELKEKVTPGNTYTSTRLDVQLATLQRQFRRIHSDHSVSNQLIEQHCIALDEPRFFLLNSGMISKPLYLSRLVYIFMAILGISYFWNMVLDVIGNKVILHVNKKIYIRPKATSCPARLQLNHAVDISGIET